MRWKVPSTPQARQTWRAPKRTLKMCSRQASSSGNRLKKSRTLKSGDADLLFSMTSIYGHGLLVSRGYTPKSLAAVHSRLPLQTVSPIDPPPRRVFSFLEDTMTTTFYDHS